jgi:hypothetical protein
MKNELEVSSSEKSEGPSRILSDRFSQALDKGKLRDLIDFVKSRDDLDLQLRGKYCDIYYNGGCALRVGPDSMRLDEFYFYLGVYKGKPIKKTYILEQLKGKAREDKPENYPSYEEAKAIHVGLRKSRDELIAKAKDHNFISYFDTAIKVVGAWVEEYKREERKKQHYIACSNRGFSQYNDLVVVDIEFAVSTLKSYNHTDNKAGTCADSKDGTKKVPKFDIIAVDRNGQLYAIELKDNLGADSKTSAQCVDGHKEDFELTIKESYGSEDSFVTEMQKVLQQKQRLKLLSDDVKINSAEPKFAIAYSGSPEDKVRFEERHPDIPMIDIAEGDATQRYLKLRQ